MTLSLSELLLLARDTVRDPRGGARRVLALPVDPGTRWMALLLTAVLSTLLTQMGFALLTGGDPTAGGLVSSPLAFTAVQLAVMVLSVLAIHHIGRWRGGRGTLPDAVLLVAWLQFILLCLQVVQLVALVVLPPLADIAGLLAMGLFFWLLSAFVAELHSFRSQGAVLGAILLVLVAVVFTLAAVLSAAMPPIPV